MSMARLWKGILMGAVAAAAISAGHVGATTGTGTTSTLIGRATFDEAFNIKRVGADGWDVKVKATPALDIAVQRIVFQPGGQSGWHSHPGPVFISVVEGEMTF
jgi:quercetin dioxygenase-like cupin family protein